jgi:hypothetical protein
MQIHLQYADIKMVENGFDLSVMFLTCCTAQEKMKIKKTQLLTTEAQA